MSNPSKSKGTRFESALVAYLRQMHPRAERRALAGTQDRGDVAGIDGWAISAKACREWRLAEWVDEAERQAKRAGVSRFAVVIKRSRKGVEDAYCVLPAWLLRELMLPDAPPSVVQLPLGVS